MGDGERRPPQGELGAVLFDDGQIPSRRFAVLSVLNVKEYFLPLVKRIYSGLFDSRNVDENIF